MVKELNTGNFQQFLSENKVALVDFTATWCPPCQMIKPFVEQLATEYAGKAGVAAVDIDKSGELAQAFQITGVPTLIVFKDGKPVDMMVGAAPKATMKQKLDGALQTA